MIDRYSITAPAEHLRERFSADVPDFYKPHYNAAPTHLLPVITGSNPKGFSTFYWGTLPKWSKNKQPGEKFINIRTEQVNEKPALKKAIQRFRCIVPADGFYGWKKLGKKTSIPYRFTLKNKDIFSIAGLWEEFEDEEGKEVQTFTLFTTASRAPVSDVQDRMPLILNLETEKIWLDPASDSPTLMQILESPATVELDYYPVSPSISNSNQNLPTMILPTPPADQHGNLTLFD